MGQARTGLIFAGSQLLPGEPRPSKGHTMALVGPDRLELSTSVLSGPRSNRLSYGPMLTQRDYINTPVSVQPRRDHDKHRTQ